MSSSAVAYLGPARSGKTQELVREYGAALRRKTLGGDKLLWLAPTSQAAAAVRRQLVQGDFAACLGPGVMTFGQLARQVVRDAGVRSRPLATTMQREVLRRVVQAALESGSLEFYAAAAERPGFIDLLAEHIRELKRREISPAALARARRPRGDERQHRELAALFADYEKLLSDHHLVDEQSLVWAARDALETGKCSKFRELDLLVADGFTDFTTTQHKILELLARDAGKFIVTLQADGESVPGTTPRPAPADPRPVPVRDRERGREVRVRSFEIDSSNQAVSVETDSAERTDLFAKTTATLAALHQHHRLEVRRFVSGSTPRPVPARDRERVSRWPALDYLAEQLFRHPRQIAEPGRGVAESLDRLEIIEAASAQDETVQIARRIKRLLAERKARADDILVVFHSLTDSAARVREVFSQYGIPHWLELGETLGTAPVVKSLLALLRLEADGWPFRGVVSVVTNNGFSAFDPRPRQAADWLVRELQVANGRTALLEQVEQLAGEPKPLIELSSHLRRRVESARAALPLFRKLAEAFDALPHEATATEWCDAWAQFGATLGLAPFVETRTPRPVPVREDRERTDTESIADPVAWESVVERFAALECLDAWLGSPARALTRDEALVALCDVARNGKLPRVPGDVGRVRVMAALTARTITARHVFLVGMSEQAFPAPERAGRLGTEAEYRMLARAEDTDGMTGPPVSSPGATRSQEEMLLFYGVLNCAEESLTISYPALDDKAQQLPPSPYVTELRRILAAARLDTFRTSAPQLSPVPAGDTPLSAAEWRVQAVARALAGDVKLLAGLVKSPQAAGIDAGLRTVHARAHGDSFGPAEGLLTSPAAAARLAERYGPKHFWSPSQWETYAACPYRFFLEHVLGIEPLGDLVLETDFARRGSRLHDVLAEFHRRWPSVRSDGNFNEAQEADAFIDHFCQVVDHRIATNRAGIDAALIELDRRQLRKWAESHRDHHARYDGQWSQLAEPLVPAHFELRFGPARPGDADVDDPHSSNNTFTLNINGELVHITGRIDRIDVARVGEQVQFTVIDYKSGRKASLKQEHIESGEQLQLPIYVAAAQALVFGGNAEPLAAGYWTMSGGFDVKGALSVQQNEGDGGRWDRIQRLVEERVGQFITAIRRGEFPVASRDEHCTSRCDFNTICRVAQVRSLGKTWPPPV